jgi:hypothetical protein
MGAQKKQNWQPVCKPEHKKDSATENLAHKAEIDRMKKLLSEKMRDPKYAKKAALIISEMLKPKN